MYFLERSQQAKEVSGSEEGSEAVQLDRRHGSPLAKKLKVVFRNVCID